MSRLLALIIRKDSAGAACFIALSLLMLVEAPRSAQGVATPTVQATVEQTPLQNKPNSSYYPELEDKSHPVFKAKYLFRQVRRCSDDQVIESQSRIFLNLPDGTRYQNYVCGSRKSEHCSGDGSPDTYYDEWCQDAAGKKIVLKTGTFLRNGEKVVLKTENPGL